VFNIHLPITLLCHNYWDGSESLENWLPLDGWLKPSPDIRSALETHYPVLSPIANGFSLSAQNSCGAKSVNLFLNQATLLDEQGVDLVPIRWALKTIAVHRRDALLRKSLRKNIIGSLLVGVDSVLFLNYKVVWPEPEYCRFLRGTGR